jgi:glycosyl hydrolase family 114
MRFMGTVAARYGMATGLKNAMDTLSEIRPYVDFAVNEECAARNECSQYTRFQKPIFHIEYPTLQLAVSVSAAEKSRYCMDDKAGYRDFHTVLKKKSLDGVVEYCDGSGYFKTPTKEVAEGLGAGGGSGRRRGGGGGKGGKINYVVAENSTDVDMNYFKSWQFNDNIINRMAEMAQEDGYPYAPGQGSERYITDEELMQFMPPEEAESNSSVSAAPQAELTALSGDNHPERAVEALTISEDVKQPKR